MIYDACLTTAKLLRGVEKYLLASYRPRWAAAIRPVFAIATPLLTFTGLSALTALAGASAIWAGLLASLQILLIHRTLRILNRLY